MNDPIKQNKERINSAKTRTSPPCPGDTYRARASGWSESKALGEFRVWTITELLMSRVLFVEGQRQRRQLPALLSLVMGRLCRWYWAMNPLASRR